VAISGVPRDRPWTLRRGGRVVAASGNPGGLAAWSDDGLALTLTVEGQSRFDLVLSSS